MPMKPEEKARQKARQEAEWARQKDEERKFVGAEYAMEPGKAEPTITPTQFDEPEMPISTINTPIPEFIPAPKPKKLKAAPIPKIPKSPARAKKPKAK